MIDPTTILRRHLDDIESNAHSGAVYPMDVVRLCETMRMLLKINEKQEKLLRETEAELKALQQLAKYDSQNTR